MLQQGTFNANPLSAAAGLAALQIVAEGEPTARANERGAQLRAGLRDVLEERGVAGAVVGDARCSRSCWGRGWRRRSRPTDVQRLMAGRGAVNTLRKAMLLNGVDLMRSGGFTSIGHGDREIEHTVQAFGRSLTALQQEGFA